MSATHTASSFDKFLLKKIHRAAGDAPVRLEFSEEKTRPSDGGGKEAIVINDRRALAKLVLDPEIGFGDAYMEGRIEVKGDLVHVLESVFRAMHSLKKRSWYYRLFS